MLRMTSVIEAKGLHFTLRIFQAAMVWPVISAPRCGGPKYMKGSAVIFLSRFVVQVNLLHCTIISVKSLKGLVGAARFELTTPSPPAMTSIRKLLETNGL